MLHPGTAFELRPYQVASLAAIREQFDAGVRSTLVVKATGTGKTVTFAEQARHVVTHGARVLILVHRDELITQALRKCEAVGLYADVEKGKRKASTLAKVVIASVQSLRGVRLARFASNHFALVIVDEAHHATAPGYRAVLDHFAEAFVLGVTATPDRADGVGLGEVFETVAYRYELRQAIAEGYLAPIVARRVVLDGVDLSTVKSRAGDLAQDELAAIMQREQALRGVVVPLLELAGDRRTIVFSVDVAHAHALAEMITSYGGTARAVSGNTDEDERESLLHGFAAGEFQYLVNCALLTEGYDEPSIQCVAMVRPTKSRGLYMQCTGRGTRLYPGKADMLLLDFTGTAGKHRLIGPVDCLAGDLEDDVRAEVDRLCGVAQRELEEVLAHADDEVSKRRAGLIENAKVTYHAEHIDPFIGDADHEGALHVRNVVDPNWEHRSPTDKQRASLEKLGITLSKLPKAFTMADASRLLARLIARSARGLCSYAQARKIAPSGIDTRQLSFKRASELIVLLKHGDWRPWVLANEPEAIAARELLAAKEQAARERGAA